MSHRPSDPLRHIASRRATLGFGTGTTMKQPKSSSPYLCGSLLVMGSVGACSEDNRPPRLEAIDDQVVAVGAELVVNLRATDPDGDGIDYGFAAELDDLDDRASVALRPDGTAVFRFTPLGEDVGQWPFDFTASDGSSSDTVTANVEIRSAVDGAEPMFREPLGSGTTLDLSVNACLNLNVVVEDQDDAAVTLGQAEPIIEDATLEQETGLSGTWSWCPNKDQLAEDRYPLVLFADDGDHDPVLKNYLVVLRAAPNPDCPGKGPTIEHEARDIASVLDVEITAEVSDDLGLKGAPLVYYTTEEPKLPLDFSMLELAEMELQSGDMELGIWTARIPNPVASQPEGARADLYYLISAVDDDDQAGECDHVTDLPDEGTFLIEVSNPGGGGGAEVCEPCSADVQCGGAADLCAVVGGRSQTFCLEACEGGCDDGFECVSVESIDGESAEQCRPSACGDEPPPTCEDDDAEENDTRAQASVQDALEPTVLEDLVACEGDEDWFRVVASDAGTLGALISGGAGTNLDLGLYDVSGAEVEVASTGTSEEVVEQCVQPGTYFLRVFSSDQGNTNYDLLYEFEAGSCSDSCQDDSAEPDDSPGQAQDVSFPLSANDRAVCAADADFFELQLDTGDTLVADLAFSHAAGDLDFHFFDSDGVDLTPCSPDAPQLCSNEAGQSASSNEHTERTIDQAGCAPCTFYLSVQGYADAANSYDIDLEVQ